jgi:hypothetical protein
MHDITTCGLFLLAKVYRVTRLGPIVWQLGLAHLRTIRNEVKSDGGVTTHGGGESAIGGGGGQ